MGYGKSSQKTKGIHIRQHSRAFAFQDDQGKNNVFVSIDSGMMGQLVKKKVNSSNFQFGFQTDGIISRLSIVSKKK